MTDFTALYDCSEPNLVGLPIIEFIPVQGVASFKTFELSDGRLRGAITLNAYFAWYKMPIRALDADKQFWEETSGLTNQGQTTDEKIQAILPMQSPAVQAQLDNMERQKFIVRIETHTGQKFVLGSVKFPLRFSSSWSSARGYHTVEFKAKQIQKAIGY